MTASRKRKRVNGWAVLYRYGAPPTMPEVKDVVFAPQEATYWRDGGWPVVPCEVTYTEPPKRKARR